MSAYSSNYFKENADRILAETVSNSDETIITLDSGEAVVMMPLDQYEAWKETRYLLSNPANREHLRKSIAEYHAGQTVSKTLEELEQIAQP